MDIYQNARHYDQLMTGPNDMPFYLRQVQKWGDPVLELGCGTGRLSIPLAAAGFDVTGLDVEPAMLEEARNKAQQRGAAIQLVQADCRNYSLDRQFRLIFFSNNSLSHLLTRTEVESCFRCVRRHLAPGGRFILDLFTPSLPILTRDPAQHYPVKRYQDPDGNGVITVTETGRYDAATQVKHIVWHYRWDSQPEAWDIPSE